MPPLTTGAFYYKCAPHNQDEKTEQEPQYRFGEAYNNSSWIKEKYIKDCHYILLDTTIGYKKRYGIAAITMEDV